jgi:lipoate-protein ligase A
VRWRYLTDEQVDAAAGLAVDEVLMLPYGRERKAGYEASLRLYTYRADCALVGRYQSLEDEIDLDYCNAHDVQVGRRPTGGGAIIMGPGQLGVAIASQARPEETPRETLRRYASGVVAGLSRLGIEARFRSKNDLEVDGRKIAGLGLYLDPRGAILFHASVLVDLEVQRMLRILRIPGAKLSDKAIARVEERVTTVSRELGRRLLAVDARPAIAEGIAGSFGVELEREKLTRQEKASATELTRTRYGNRDWIRQSSARRDARGSALLKTPTGLLRIYVGVHGDVLKSVLVTGDFNILPPGIARLESALKWCRVDPERIAGLTIEALTEEDFGVSPTKIAGTIWQAARSALDLVGVSHPQPRDGACYFPDAATRAATEPPQLAEEKT